MSTKHYLTTRENVIEMKNHEELCEQLSKVLDHYRENVLTLNEDEKDSFLEYQRQFFSGVKSIKQERCTGRAVFTLFSPRKYSMASPYSDEGFPNLETLVLYLAQNPNLVVRDEYDREVFVESIDEIAETMTLER